MYFYRNWRFEKPGSGAPTFLYFRRRQVRSGISVDQRANTAVMSIEIRVIGRVAAHPVKDPQQSGAGKSQNTESQSESDHFGANGLPGSINHGRSILDEINNH